MHTNALLTSDSRTLFHVLRGVILLVAGAVLTTMFGLRDVHAQAEGPSLRSTQRPVRVVVDPTYQYYETEGGRVLTQLSTRLSTFVPIRQRFSVRAAFDYARMGGDQLTQVQGPTDVAAGVTYAQPVGEGSVVFSLGANVPTGKQKLNPQELTTTRFISQNFYDFEVSSYSRGLSVSPQVTWALPVTDRLAVGIGGGYQYQQGFRPTATLQEDYVPGDGIGANGGFDYKITDASAIGVDVAYRRYAPDRVGGSRRFDAGSRVAGTVRYLLHSGFTTIRGVVQYASWEESEYGFQTGGSDRGQVLPPHGLALASYKTRLVEGIRLHVRASGHWYGETIQEEQKIVGRAYVSPSFEIQEMVTVEPHGTVTYGSYLGLGGGVRIAGSF